MTRRALAGVALLAAVVPIAISLRSGFHSDDFFYLELLDSGRFSIRFFGTNLFGDAGVGGEYRPVVLASFWLNHWLGGSSPIGYHVVNAGLHVGSAALLAALVRRLFESRLAAAAAGLAFLLHPVQVEPVNWVAGRNDLLTVFFLLAGLVGFLRLRESAARPAAWIALFAGHVLALFCKEYATFLPVLVAAIALGFRNRLDLDRRAVFVAVLGTLVLSALYVVVRVATLGSLGGYLESPPFTVASAARRLLEYADLALFATWRSQYAASPFLARPLVFAALIAVAGAAVFLARPSRERGLPAFALAVPWFVLPLLPVSNLWLAERYLYFSIAGLAILVAAGVAWLETRSATTLRRVGLGAAAVALVSCGVVHARKALFWNDTGRIVASLPDTIVTAKPAAIDGLAVAIRGSGDVFRSAIVWSPGIRNSSDVEFLVRKATGRIVRAVVYDEPETIGLGLDGSTDVLFLEMTPRGWLDVTTDQEPRWRKARQMGGDIETALTLEAKGAPLEAYEMLDQLAERQPFAATQAARIAQRLRGTREGAKRWDRAIARALEIATTDLDFLKLLAENRDAGFPAPAALFRMSTAFPAGSSPREKLARAFFEELRGTDAGKSCREFVASLRGAPDDSALAVFLGWLAREPASTYGISADDVRRATVILFRAGEDAAVKRVGEREGAFDSTGECARLAARATWFIDPTPETPPADAEILPTGVAFDLGPEPARRYLREGWSQFYERYADARISGGVGVRRWTEGRESTFVFRMPSGASPSSFWLRAGSSIAVQNVRIFVNGEKRQDGRIAGKFNAIEVSAPLRREDGPVVVVRVVVRTCLPPKQRGDGADERPLGLWVHAFGVR
ncbi:MAG: hypothetical protein HY292_09965 [Planctomycetes bacterium]|nr:hypothetical protein [Planctomycetota bacterium]